LIVVVPDALQFQMGAVAKLDAHVVESTFTEGGRAPPPLYSQEFDETPSQSRLPAGHEEHEPLEHVWLVVHATVVQDEPQLEPVLIGFSQPFVVDPSQLRKPVGQLVHEPPVHVWVFAPHAAGEPHCPPELHVSTALPEHCVDAGTQTPVQPPETHAEATHAEPVPHVPLPVHVWTLLPEHWAAPGEHTPVQLPLTQA
jgi:hypothetical protein